MSSEYTNAIYKIFISLFISIWFVFVISSVIYDYGSFVNSEYVNGTISYKFNHDVTSYNIMYKMDTVDTEYVFIMNNNTSIIVTESIYNSYDIGDYYSYKRRI